jgi:hypothetical protein
MRTTTPVSLRIYNARHETRKDIHYDNSDVWDDSLRVHGCHLGTAKWKVEGERRIDTFHLTRSEALTKWARDGASRATSANPQDRSEQQDDCGSQPSFAGSYLKVQKDKTFAEDDDDTSELSAAATFGSGSSIACYRLANNCTQGTLGAYCMASNDLLCETAGQFSY